MPRATARREKWTLSFDAELKAFLIKAARRRRLGSPGLAREDALIAATAISPLTRPRG
jgi:predicted nucleic acid-binding protein